tara:strand:+ start:436 stop:747 length:312 start_codon:yes stop_codon:yes gene_type:complete
MVDEIIKEDSGVKKETDTPTPDIPKLTPIERGEAYVKAMKEENDRFEKLVKDNQQAAADSMLAGTAGGHVETPKISEEQKKVNDAVDFFKGTQLEADIKKANE